MYTTIGVGKHGVSQCHPPHRPDRQKGRPLSPCSSSSCDPGRLCTVLVVLLEVVLHFLAVVPMLLTSCAGVLVVVGLLGDTPRPPRCLRLHVDVALQYVVPAHEIRHHALQSNATRLTAHPLTLVCRVPLFYHYSSSSGTPTPVFYATGPADGLQY